uniref:Uncharacterized protein n=1 Tax=Trypanosoma vivax (strain Y486) TaxID=1055687 RepID=G0TZM9_TRYVY|nr:hypothetical protein TVY486_0806640 [Trypanosoma vivax Y486]
MQRNELKSVRMEKKQKTKKKQKNKKGYTKAGHARLYVMAYSFSCFFIFPLLRTTLSLSSCVCVWVCTNDLAACAGKNGCSAPSCWSVPVQAGYGVVAGRWAANGRNL